MNNVDLAILEQKRQDALKHYGLDDESVKAFRKSIKKVSKTESDSLGKELYELLKERGNTRQDSYLRAHELIKDGANLEYKTDEKGDFPLLLCARRNKLKFFILLVKAGANINQSNKYQTTSTMTSARHGNKEILSLLILLGANINAQCKDGDNALMSAKRNNQTECFELLKQANAMFGIRNNLNQTVIDIPSTTEFDFTEFSCLNLKNEDPLTGGYRLIKEAEAKLAEFKRDNLQLSKTLK